MAVQVGSCPRLPPRFPAAGGLPCAFESGWDLGRNPWKALAPLRTEMPKRDRHPSVGAWSSRSCMLAARDIG